MQNEKFILSFDCGIKNTGWSLHCFAENQHKVIDLGLLEVGKTHQQITFNIKQLKKQLKVSHEWTILLEQQPQINRQSCMVHDIIRSVFYKNNEQYSQQPSKKNKFIHDFLVCQKGKHKQFSIEVSRDFLKNDQQLVQKFNSFKKKDDVADSILQCLYFVQAKN